MIEVYLGLGSNLADPQSQITRALRALCALNETKVIQCSSLYASLPMGPKTQADYVNAVVYLHTNLRPLELLNATQNIELQQGRERKSERWGPRTLDIDILLYGQQMINSDELVVPHYGLKVREFVLYPLLEINPQLCLPDGERLAEIAKKCPLNDLSIVSAAPTVQTGTETSV